MSDYDVCVIGGGPAGYATAMRLWDHGKRVCVVERGRLGGAGVHDGALSSKTLWELSKDYRRAISHDRGYTPHRVDVDFGAVMNVVEQATGEKTRQMERQIDALSHPLPGCPGSLDFVHGTARFVDAHRVRVAGRDAADTREITADHFVIATGSRPRHLGSIDIDGEAIITSDHISRMTSFPRSMVILGAGVVGCEFATIFANFGCTKVYMIDRQPRILPFEDADVARVCATNLEARGVTVHHRAQLRSMQRVGDQVEYTIEHPTGGIETITVDKALISIGRVPNTEELGLEAAGVEISDRGHIVDTDTLTSVENIYAVGDVTYDIALVNVGEIEGRHAAERICGTATGTLAYDNLSTIMFLDPEVAAIGLNELQAQKKRIPYRVAVYDYSLVNRAIAMRATEGFVKLLVSDDDEMRILGMRALGAHASTSLEAVSLMIQHGRSARDLAELLHPHPAITEGLQDCVRMLLGSSVYKPLVFQSALRLSRVAYDEAGEATESSE
jgi:dihydrolipoamide dehydrogenase